MGTFALAVDVDEFDGDVGFAVAQSGEFVFAQKFVQIISNDVEGIIVRLFRDGDDDFHWLLEFADVGLRLGGERVGA